MAKILSYEYKDTWIDRLTGVTKLAFFLVWSIISMVTYDTRVLAVMFVLSLVIFKVSQIRKDQVMSVFKFILFFLILNVLFIYIFSPDQGCKIYHSRTVLLPLGGHYDLTYEQLFYELNIVLKYFTVAPAVLMFVLTTHPSEFAASLNRLKIGYTVDYAVALALRYIPDVQRDYTTIKHAQEARGIEMSSKASLFKRTKRMAAIIFPLIFTSMDRIDVVSTAMELRGFGKKKKRTWYSARALTRNDYLVLIFLLLFTIVSLFITFHNGSRFYNPF